MQGNQGTHESTCKIKAAEIANPNFLFELYAHYNGCNIGEIYTLDKAAKVKQK